MEKVSVVLNEFLPPIINGVDYLGDDDEVLEMGSILEGGKLVDFEAPDAYVCYGDTILLIEHFQFDASRKTRKGSLSQQQMEKIDSSFEKMMVSKTENSFHEVNNADTNYELYIQTFKSNFDKHYSQIEKYISNVKLELGANFPSKIRICFLVTDSTPIVLSVIDKGIWESVVLTRSKEILELLQSNPRVDWIFTSLSMGANQRGYFYSQKYSQQYMDNAISYGDLKQVPTKPHIVGGKITI